MKRVLLLACALAACGKSARKPDAAPEKREPEKPKVLDESRFPHVEVTRSDGPRPAALQKPLPTSIEQRDDYERTQEWLSADVYASLVCLGDRAMRGQIVDALAAAPPRDVIDMLHYYASSIDRCYGLYCPWLIDELPGSKGIERALLFQMAVRCTDHAYDALFDADDAPPQAVIARAGNGHYSKRLDTVAREELAIGDAFRHARALRALGLAGDPAAMALLLELHAAATDPEERERLAEELARYRPDPAAATIGDDFCRRHAEYGVCAAPYTEPADPKPTVDELSACVRDKREVDRRICLDDLVRRDRARAVAVAKPILDEKDLDVRTRDTIEALLRFPEKDDLVRHLTELGLLGVYPLPADGAYVEAMEVLRPSGAATHVMTSMSLSTTDLYETLGVLVRTALPGLYVDSGPDRALNAYVNGAVYTAHEADDVPRLTTWVGLLDGVLQAEKSPVRCVALYVKEEVPSVLCGPGDAILAALDEKLFGSADQTYREPYQ